MNTVGVVSEIYKNDLISKKTGKPFKVYFVRLNDGSVYENGYTMPPVSVGDTVSIEYEVSYGKNKVSSISKGGAGAPTPTPARSGSPSARRFPVDIDSPEMSIIRQSALKAAVDVWGHLYDTVEDVDDNKVAERIINMAYKFTEFSSGQREVRMLNDES